MKRKRTANAASRKTSRAGARTRNRSATAREARVAVGRALAAEYRHLEEVLGLLSRVSRRMSRQKARDALDRSMWQEMLDLMEKIARLMQSKQVPPPDAQWNVIMEIIALLFKLVWKAYWLQARGFPPIDPKLPNPSA